MYLLTSLVLLLMVLISVGFFTLLERKVLSYMQIRKGPNKVGYLGIFQPFSDGIKLFVNEQFFPMNSNYILYMICPFFSLLQSLFLWVMFPYFFNNLNLNFGLLFFLCCSTLSVYGLIICGWSSNSMYSMLGCIRSVSQAISYEISFSLILLCYFIVIDSYNFIEIYFFNGLWFIFLSFPLFFVWFSCCLAETNRTPFDFSEGESELVSGFNVEYGSGSFALLFISEYSSIIFMSMISGLVFLGGNFVSFFFFLKIIFLCYCFIWIRCSLPRYRYDKLMYMAWKCYLPLSMNYFLFFVFLKLINFYHFFLLSY
uniref:NADH-ubiquinone oxidoreductase chain 1 n=1 Tax=Sophonia fuscomarginata TaxID=3092774 RepID=A0AAF0Z436_9HEMI|nr:NADH dehydrogenase subunit 1 [Sophonia fuscomarginata]WPC85272.1 NADH dehydrogenase subunit 1 [Sophonia fuscomarginata]